MMITCSRAVSRGSLHVVLCPLPGREDLQSVGCVLKNLQGCGHTAVSHMRCRVTQVCDCGLMPWLLEDSELSVCRKEGISLLKIRPGP